MFHEELAALDAQPAAPAPPGQPTSPDPNEQKRQLFQQALVARQAAADALGKMKTSLPLDATRVIEAAKETQAKIEELRRFFFSIVEHLKDLARQQAETLDQTASSQAQTDPAAMQKALAPLGSKQQEHATLAEAIAQALKGQADQASQAPAAPSGAAGAVPTDPAQQAQTLAEAATEVTSAENFMRDASQGLSDANKTAATMSPDLEPTLKSQAQALEHIQNAIALLEPPPQQKQEQKNEQQPQQQQSQQQAAKRLQEIRDREADRRRDRERAQGGANDSVEKDW